MDGGGGDDQERKNFLFLLEWKTKKERESCLGGRKKKVKGHFLPSALVHTRAKHVEAAGIGVF